MHTHCMPLYMALIVFMHGAVSIGRSSEPQPAEIKYHEMQDCGPVSLALVCRLLGVDVSLDKLREMTVHDVRGASASDLVAAAKQVGLSPLAVECGAEVLVKKNCIGIAGVKGHYVVVIGVERQTGRLLIVDIPHKPYYVAIGDFKKMWGGESGFVILFPQSKRARVPQGVPSIKIEPEVQSLGPVWVGDVASCKFTVRNAGSGNLRIARVRACCGSKVAISKDDILPGETCELLFAYKCQDGSGTYELNKSILLVTNSRPDNVVAARVHVTVRPRYVLDPNPIAVRAVNNTNLDDLTREVAASFIDDPSTVVTGVTCSDEWLSATVLSQEHEKPQRIVVRVRKLPDECGPHDSSVRVQTSNRKYPVLELPVHLYREGEYAISPDQVAMGVLDANVVATGELWIRRRVQGVPFAINAVTADSEMIGIAKASKGLQREHYVVITVRTPSVRGRYEGHVVVELGDGDRIRIPVSGYVLPQKEQE